MLTGLLDDAGPTGARAPELYPDVLPAMVGLAELGTLNLIDYAPMPEGHEHVLPPFTTRVDGPAAPSDLVPELHDTEAALDRIATFERIDAAIAAQGEAPDDVVLVSNTVAQFAQAAERGWLTVWLNRDRVANLSDTAPSVEIHSLLDLPEALDAIADARIIIAEFAAAEMADPANDSSVVELAPGVATAMLTAAPSTRTPSQPH